MTYEIFLRLGTSTYYKLTNLSQLTLKHSSPVSAMPLPEDVAESNMLIKIEGNSETVSLSWVATDSSVGLAGTSISYSGGKYVLDDVNSAVKTPLQQVNFLRSKMPTGIDSVSYRILALDNAFSDFDLEQTESNTHLIKIGTFLDFTSNFNSNNPVTADINVEFITGSQVQTLSANRSGAPKVTAVVGSTGGAKTVTVTYNDFVYANASDKPATIGGYIKIKDINGFNTSQYTTASVTTAPTAGIGGVLTFINVSLGSYEYIFLAIGSGTGARTKGTFSDKKIISFTVT